MPLNKLREKSNAWLRIARPQFYPMALIAYSMGTVAAFVTSHKFDLPVFFIGYTVLFLIEFCTILTNEYYDYGTDRLNQNFSMFTGGTRILVEGKLQFHEIKIGITVALFLVIGLGYLLVRINREASPLAIFLFILSGIVLGLGYTAPPLKFSYHGLGEMVVSITHSIYLILCGYAFQTGTVSHPLPWLLSIPLSSSVLAAITLAGLPDYVADKTVSKKTITVLFGPKVAIVVAASFVCIAFLSGLTIWYPRVKWWAFSIAMVILPLHGFILLRLLHKLFRSNHYNRRINGIMGSALTYILWFGLIPLISLIEWTP
jgi:1,4-dihydroxy-2-naphthoate octaprenyltransferase